jgi:hypothetical protein
MLRVTAWLASEGRMPVRTTQLDTSLQTLGVAGLASRATQYEGFAASSRIVEKSASRITASCSSKSIPSPPCGAACMS